MFKKLKLFLIFCSLGIAFFAFYRANYEVPILMYHRITEPEGKDAALSVSPKTFEKQMEFLKSHRYRVISLEELIQRLRARRSAPFNTVVITFDDGTVDNIGKAYPILRKMNLPATIFMITDNIGKEGWLADEDLRLLDEAGIAIGSHTVHHRYLPDVLTDDEVRTELRDSKKRLESILGHSISLFSYPAGGADDRIEGLVEKEGYTGAVTTNYGRKKADLYALHRIKIKESGSNLFNFWLKTSGLYQLGKKHIERD